VFVGFYLERVTAPTASVCPCRMDTHCLLWRLHRRHVWSLEDVTRYSLCVCVCVCVCVCGVGGEGMGCMQKRIRHEMQRMRLIGTGCVYCKKGTMRYYMHKTTRTYNNNNNNNKNNNNNNCAMSNGKEKIEDNVEIPPPLYHFNTQGGLRVTPSFFPIHRMMMRGCYSTHFDRGRHWCCGAEADQGSACIPQSRSRLGFEACRDI
jgi:hypothetical protein